MIPINIGGMEFDGHIDKYNICGDWVETQIAYRNVTLIPTEEIPGKKTITPADMWKFIKLTIRRNVWEENKNKWWEK